MDTYGTAGSVGVAISTTGDEHRLDLLRGCVAGWDLCLPDSASLFVTVDGDEAAVARVAGVVDTWTRSVFQVGEPYIGNPMIGRDGRLGVAVNKNTGLELLMNNAQVDHLFLSDDDTWPLNPEALHLHTRVGSRGHSMVNWGRHRLSPQQGPCAWSWPRGAVLYASRLVVEQVGGMVEAFGPGGHEHVEWSRRIHEHGFTETLYPAPSEYSAFGGLGAARYWHAEDMQRKGEPRASTISRRRHLTSVRRRDGDWEHINQIMVDMDGVTRFVPYQAEANGRSSATLYHSSAN